MIERANYSIRVVTTLEEFASLSAEWNHFLRQTASDGLFLTWDWLYAWAKHYLGRNQLWILMGYRKEGSLSGIAPFYIRRSRVGGFFPVREVRFLGTEEVCSSYLDFIVLEKEKKAFLQDLFHYLYREARDAWDLLTLPEIPAESTTIDLLSHLIEEKGKVVEVAGMTACPTIHLTGRLGDFLAGISGNERYNLQRKKKKLEQAGEIGYDRILSRSLIEKEMDAFIRLHEIRWKQKGIGGSFKSKRFTAFHREIAALLGDQGSVRLDFLSLNGEKVAGIYGYVYQGRYSFYLPGFNPEVLPQASPGILLLLHCIEKSIEEGCYQVDLLRGLTDYKMAWANDLRRALTLRHYNRHLAAALVKLLDGGKQWLKILIR